jgi:hypothetical protein
MNAFISYSLFIGMNCIKCNNELTGKQIKYCCYKCKNNYLNNWHNTAEKQKQKGIARKLKLLKMMGELKCSECGYSKNLSCLSFHHKNPAEKKFPLDQRICSMYSMKRLIEEAKKCKVLCLNCHSAHHNPQHEIVGSTGLEPVTKAL